MLEINNMKKIEQVIFFCYFGDLKIRNKDRIKCDVTIGNKQEG